MSDTRESEGTLLPYTEPLLRDHGSLRDLTGKSGESAKGTVDSKGVKDEVEKGSKDAGDKGQKEAAEKTAKDTSDSKGKDGP